MILLRFVIFLVLIAIGLSGVMYLFTRNPRYLKLSWQILKFALIFAIIVMVFYVLERLILVV